jgi:hypothetical protein
MNVKLHTPSTLKAGSGLSSFKQFLLSIVATTISIVLTFGTAAILDHNKKESAKKEMVMMVISDFDQTIEILQKADTVLRKASSAQLDLTTHPEHFDSLQSGFIEVASFIIHDQVFPETTEKIFTSSIETFNTIGNVNFVNEVSSFYISRHRYKDLIQSKLKEEIEETGVLQSINTLFNANFPLYSYTNWAFLQDMKEIRDRCVMMMNVNEEELAEFNQQHTTEHINPERKAQEQKMQEEMREAMMLINEAQEK